MVYRVSVSDSSSDDDMRRCEPGRASNDPPPATTNTAEERGNRSSGQGSQGSGNRTSGKGKQDTGNRPSGQEKDTPFVLPKFVSWDYVFPTWKPDNMSDQEFGLLRALTGNLPRGKDSEFRQRILDLQPLLQNDSTNPFYSQGKQLSFLTRHSDREAEKEGRDRLSGQDGFIEWRAMERATKNKKSWNKLMPAALSTMDALDLACLILFNDKGRFECQVRIRYDRADKNPIPSLYIRATQGHSYSVDRELL